MYIRHESLKPSHKIFPFTLTGRGAGWKRDVMVLSTVGAFRFLGGHSWEDS